MSDAKVRSVRATSRDDRAREASRAMQEYEAKRRADVNKTARLRALHKFPISRMVAQTELVLREVAQHSPGLRRLRVALMTPD